MPLCAKCSKPFQCTCGAPDRKVLGVIAEDCPIPKKPGAIWVHISDDGGTDVKDVDATNDGAPKPSGIDGLAVFDPVPAGKHVIDLKPLSDELLKRYEKPTADTKRRVHVNDGEIGYVMYTLPRKPALKVKVVEKGGPKLFGTATVALSGAQSASKPTDAVTGVADFGRVLAGKYEIVTTLSEEDGKTHATTVDFSKAKVPVELVAGQEQETVVEAELINVVTPKIEMEYKVVLLDRKLHAKQAQTETKILPGLTYIQVSADQTNKAHAFAKGGKLEFAAVTGGAVEAFRDEACQFPFNGTLSTKQLVGESAPYKVWLRGATPGKFKATLTLDKPADRFVKLADKPAEEEMGVVELKMEVHWFVKADVDGLADLHPDVEPIDTYHTELKDLALPDQKALTDDQKVQVGRVLHVQNEAGVYHDRAKLVVKKLVADQWPAGCDKYKITLTQGGASGAVVFFDGRETGAEMEVWPGPFPYVSGQDVVWWVQGKAACRALRDVVVDLGIDREAGGLAKTAKRNGDWARFTPVKIEEVKLEYVQEPKADNAWDATKKRYYININKKDDPDGRKIHLSARLSEKIEGVPIYFMLAPDKDNRKIANWGIDFPADGRHFTVNANGTITAGAAVKWKDVGEGLKEKDRADRKRLLHLGAPTDKSGFVKQEVQLSRFGGDKFHPAAYIEQDPHLAKYVHGHNTLGLRVPPIAKVTPIQVWRKVYFQSTEPLLNELPTSDGFHVSQRKVFIEPEITERKKMAKADFKIDPYRPAWQYKANAGATERMCIGDHNYLDAMKLFVEPTLATTPKLNVIVCDEQYDAEGVETAEAQVTFINATPQDVAMTCAAGDFAVFDPPLQGGPLIATGSGRWQLESVDTAFFTRKVTQTIRHSGTLKPANVTLVATRASTNLVRVTPPTQCDGAAGGCPCGGKPTALTIDNKHLLFAWVKVQAATGPWGGWAPDGYPTIVAQREGPTEADNVSQDTLGHEMGHQFGQTRHAPIADWPDHPLYYQQRGGSGTHCSFAAAFTADPTAPPLVPSTANQLDATGKAAGEWDGGTCQLYHSATHYKREWCKHCALDYIQSDLSKFS